MTLLFPTSLIMGRLSFSILVKGAEKHIVFTDEQKDKIIKLLKMTRKKYKGLKLVDVKTADGQIVEITL